MKLRADSNHRIPGFVRLAIVCALFLFSSIAGAQIAGMPPEMERIGVKEHLDQPLPLDTTFRDQNGKTVKLGDFFDGKHPVVLTFAYHTCPVICGMILNNEADGLKGVPWTLGDKFRAVTISINPDDTLEAAQKKRATVLKQYGRTVVDEAWTMLLGDKANIDRVAAAAGFEYQYDERQKQYGHPSVVMVVTPDGKMARYLYGLEFGGADLKLALLEASKGKSITTVEQIILYCYHYDPQGGKYVIVAMRVMQVGGGIVALLLGTFLAVLWGREIRKHRKRNALRAADAAA